MHQQQLELALRSLSGLSVGDALGERFFGAEEEAIERIARRELPPNGPCGYTDDTEMALSVVEVLRNYGAIQQNKLAVAFVSRFNRARGYGGSAQQLISAIGKAPNGAWRSLAPATFSGRGSFGNGSAMRVAPLGAYFSDDYPKAAEEAEKSSVITHTHREGIAGAVATAIATAWLARKQPWDRDDFYDTLLEWTPAGQTWEGIKKGRELPTQTHGRDAAQILGSGQNTSAQDTVPFAIWAVSCQPEDFASTFWRTVEGLGDRDTTCAIACGIIGARTLPPPDWLALREDLPFGFNPGGGDLG